MFLGLNEKGVSNEIIRLFLDVDFRWKQQLLFQLKSARYTASYVGSSYFLDFEPNLKCPKIDVQNIVPIYIIIDHESAATEHRIYTEDQRFMFPCKSTFPTAFHLYVRNGYLKEIEVYSLTGDILDMNNVCVGARHYVILD